MLGTVFRVVTQDPKLANHIDALFGDFERTARPARAAHILQITGHRGEPHTLHKGCYRRATRDEAKDLLPSVVATLNQATIEETREFAAHSAVIAKGDRIIALPADSGGGKTTLAAASVLAGFSYLSDEALVLGDKGQVIPYPKPMALSPWSCEKLGLEPGADERLFTPADLGGKTLGQSGVLTDVVVAHYGHETPTIELRPSSEAVPEFIGKSFNHYKDPERAFRLATETARKVRVWRLDYGDPKEAVDTLLETVT